MIGCNRHVKFNNFISYFLYYYYYYYYYFLLLSLLLLLLLLMLLLYKNKFIDYFLPIFFSTCLKFNHVHTIVGLIFELCTKFDENRKKKMFENYGLKQMM